MTPQTVMALLNQADFTTPTGRMSKKAKLAVLELKAKKEDIRKIWHMLSATDEQKLAELWSQ